MIRWSESLGLRVKSVKRLIQSHNYRLLSEKFLQFLVWQIKRKTRDLNWRYFTFITSRTEISKDLPRSSTVTVVVTFHRNLTYAHEALLSIKNQTRPPDQIIVVLSDLEFLLDSFRIIIEDLNFPTFESLICKDGSAAENRNASLNLLKSEYVLFLDGDDFLAPMAIEILMFNIGNDSKTIVGADCIFYPTTRIYWVKREITVRLLEIANQVNISTLIPVQILRQMGGFRTSFVRTFHLPEDWDLWLRISRSGMKIFNITTPLFFYRQHAESTTSAQSASTYFLEERWRPLIGVEDDQIWITNASSVESYSISSKPNEIDGYSQTTSLTVILTDCFDEYLVSTLLALQSEYKINYVVCLDADQDAYSHFFRKFGDEISFVSLSMSFLNHITAINYAVGLESKATTVLHVNDSNLNRIIEKSK